MHTEAKQTTEPETETLTTRPNFRKAYGRPSTIFVPDDTEWNGTQIVQFVIDDKTYRAVVRSSCKEEMEEIVGGMVAKIADLPSRSPADRLRAAATVTIEVLQNSDESIFLLNW